MWCESVGQLDTVIYFNTMGVFCNYHPDSLLYVANPPSGCETYGEMPAKIKESDILDYITLYPNPAGNYINVRIKKEILSCLFTLFDATGKVMYSKELMSNNNRINISHLSSGVYIATFVHGDNRAYIKFVKE